jgi:hypothetical protein
VMRPVLARVQFDSVLISEDMAFKEHSMISPAMARRFLLPAYRRWAEEIRASGCPILDMDSDGYVADLLPVWIEGGITCCCPVEVAAGNDIIAYRRRYGRKMAFHGGIDKRAIARGGDARGGDVRRAAATGGGRLHPLLRSWGAARYLVAELRGVRAAGGGVDGVDVTAGARGRGPGARNGRGA